VIRKIRKTFERKLTGKLPSFPRLGTNYA